VERQVFLQVCAHSTHNETPWRRKGPPPLTSPADNERRLGGFRNAEVSGYPLSNVEREAEPAKGTLCIRKSQRSSAASFEIAIGLPIPEPDVPAVRRSHILTDIAP
jgi:hypothetical protein